MLEEIRNIMMLNFVCERPAPGEKLLQLYTHCPCKEAVNYRPRFKEGKSAEIPR